MSSGKPAPLRAGWAKISQQSLPSPYLRGQRTEDIPAQDGTNLRGRPAGTRAAPFKPSYTDCGLATATGGSGLISDCHSAHGLGAHWS
jgi:hypothetical protein